MTVFISFCELFSRFPSWCNDILDSRLQARFKKEKKGTSIARAVILNQYAYCVFILREGMQYSLHLIICNSDILSD